MFSIARSIGLVITVLALASGCGGGGGGGAVSAACPTIGVCTGFVGDLNWELAGLAGGGGGGDGSGPGDGGDGGGGAAAGGDLGQFRRALVIAKYPDGSLVGNGSALTDDSGLVTVRPGKTYGGPLLLELHGQPDAVYYDEGKNTFIPFPPGQVLRAYIPTVASNMAITPFSEAAYRLLIEGDTAERATGVPKRAQIETANNKIRDIINLQFPASVQIADVTRLPIIKSDSTAAGSIGIDNRGAHSLITGAFSKQAAMFNPADPAPTLSATAQLAEDLLDGHLDGMRSGRPTAPADKRTYDPHTVAGELSSALAQQSFRFGTNTAIDAMPSITNFGNSRYETYLFDAKLTPSGQAILTVAGWDGANDKNRNTGEARPLLTDIPRIQSVHGNFGHGSLFMKTDSDNSTSRLFAVGDNSNGELGIGNRNTTTAAPVEVNLPGTMTHIAGGFAHTVARLADGSVYAWGDNSYGQLGQGLPSAQLLRSETPMKVTLPRGAIAVAASNVASYALLDDGSVYSWGSSWGLGLLGDGTKDGVRTSPAAVLSGTGALSGVVQIAARDNDAVVLRSDGSVMTWGSFPADQTGGFTGGRQVATPVTGLPDPATVRIRKVLTEQGLFVAQTTTGAVYHWGLHFDLTAQEILRDVTAVQVLNLPPVRDIMPGGFLGYGERPFDRVTAMGADPNGGLWKIRGRVAELFDPANPTAQRRPKSQGPRPDCSSCHNVLPTWPIKAPTPTSNLACVLPSFKLDASGRPVLVTSATECTMCHNNSPLPFLNCVVPVLPAASTPSIPPVTTAACQIPAAHVATPAGTVCATCHNSIIAQPLKCLPNTATDPLAPTTRVAITAVIDDFAPATGTIAIGGITNDPTPTVNGSIGSALASGQSVQILRNGTVVGNAIVNGTTWSLTDTSQPQGTYSYTARVVQDGRFGPLSPNHTITIDTAGPSTTILSLLVVDNAGSVTGDIPSGASTDDNTPQLQGTLSAPLGAGESIRVLLGGVDVGAATVTGTSFVFSSPTLPNGPQTFNVRVADSAGNLSSNLTRTLVVDNNSTLVPSPATSILNALDDFGTIQLSLGNNSVSDDATPTLRGTISRALVAANGEQVRVYRAGVGSFSLATVSGTTWSFTPSPALADGTYTFTAQIVDSQGRFGNISNSFTIRIDRVAPGTSLAVSATGNYPPLAGGIGSITNDNTPRITISLRDARAADESFIITRSLGGGATTTINPTINGASQTTFFFDEFITSSFADVSAPTPVNPLPAGPRYTGPALPSAFTPLSVQYVVRLTDAAGNLGPAATLSFTLNYPSCAGRQPANHTASTDCAACHRAGNGFVMVPPGPSPRYWCRN